MTLEDARKVFNTIRGNTSRTSLKDPYAIDPVREYLIPLDIITPNFSAQTDRAGDSNTPNPKVAVEQREKGTNTDEPASQDVRLDSPKPAASPSHSDTTMSSPLPAPKQDEDKLRALSQPDKPHHTEPAPGDNDGATKAQVVKALSSAFPSGVEGPECQPMAYSDRSESRTRHAAPPIPGLGGIIALREDSAVAGCTTVSEQAGAGVVESAAGGEDSGEETA